MIGAIADAILSNLSYLASVRKVGQRYPLAGYGGMAEAFFGGIPPEMQSLVENLCLDSSSHIRYKTASCCFTRTRRAYMEEQDEDGACKKSLFRYDGQSRYPCERRQAL